MNPSCFSLHLWWRVLAVLVSFSAAVVQPFRLNTDGVLLLSFKYSVLSDPLGVLENWNYSDETPCSWTGVACAAAPGEGSSNNSRVTALALPNSQILGSIPADLGMIEFLQNLNLSNNSLNGSLPFSLFNASQLRILDLSDNLISGQLPETMGRIQNLQLLNLSDNAFAGKLPVNLTSLQSLTVVSLKNNYFSDGLPSNFNSVQFLDLSSNLVNGSLPPDFGGYSLRYLNLSYNRICGEIPSEFGEKIPGNAKIDLSFNNLTGKIPESNVFMNQERSSFSGNDHDLCGPPTTNPCLIPSSFDLPSPTSPPAIAAIPKSMDSSPPANPHDGSSIKHRQEGSQGLRPGAISGIVIGDVAGIGILAVVSFYVYRSIKRKNIESTLKKEANAARETVSLSPSSSSSESRGFTRWSCLRKRGDGDQESDTSVSDVEENYQSGRKLSQDHNHRQQDHDPQNKKGTLVTVDGEKELELETLLKASAYILGASGSSIVYKAVLEDGSALAVRRIGENSVDRFRNFETQVRVISKLVHPNLVRIRGFYWGVDEKLIIYDFVPNGSLATARYINIVWRVAFAFISRHRKLGSSPCHLPWESRLKIAKGVARGLAFLHEKKHVHGNLKPGNVLLGADMEPKVGDFGLERLVTGESSSKVGGSARNFGSKRSTASRDSFQDVRPGPSPSPSPSPSSIGGISPYHAPESLRSIKANAKWDVYSFGVIFLELLTGKVIIVDELGQGNGLVVEDTNRALRLADPAIRADFEGKEDVLLACFKLGYSCASPLPQKRPSMKEALQVLEKIPSSHSPFFYGH